MSTELYAWEYQVGHGRHADRDFETAPYERLERRVAEYLYDVSYGGGDDPIGYLIVSHNCILNQAQDALEAAHAEMAEAKETISNQEEDLETAKEYINAATVLALDTAKALVDAREEIAEKDKEYIRVHNEVADVAHERNSLLQQAEELQSENTELKEQLREAEYQTKVARGALFAARQEWARAQEAGMVGAARSALFVGGKFTAHSGAELAWKIECDSLTAEDLATLAAEIACDFKFSHVYGVPSGGNKIAKALMPYCGSEGGLLIVDDVLTTGASMEEAKARHPGPCQGVVLFARGLCPEWITPVLRLGIPRKTHLDHLDV